MLDAAGTEKRPRRIAGAMAAQRDAEIVALRIDGWSVNKIAASFSLTQRHVRTILARAEAEGAPIAPSPRRHSVRAERAFGAIRWRVLDPAGHPKGPLLARRAEAEAAARRLDAPPVRTHCRCCGADLADKNRRRLALRQSLCTDCLDHGYDRRMF